MYFETATPSYTHVLFSTRTFVFFGSFILFNAAL